MMQEENKAQFQRLFEITNCKTQAELAWLLQVSQSAISEALKRAKIPDNWLIKLLSLQMVNPDWIKFGTEPKFLKLTKPKTSLRKIRAKKPKRGIR